MYLSPQEHPPAHSKGPSIVFQAKIDILFSNSFIFTIQVISTFLLNTTKGSSCTTSRSCTTV